ncbi:MAG: MauE/DoxX family redox-associated membrane protein [Mucilaginibacter sp.]
MKKSPGYLLHFICFLLIVLWVYAAASKLLAFSEFQDQMSEQPLPPVLQHVLAYLLPAGELAAAGLLVFKRTTVTGLYGSAIMLTVFTAYIALGLLHVFARVPCSCGGILQHLGWGDHLVFNSIFLLINIIGIHQSKREEVFPVEM